MVEVRRARKERAEMIMARENFIIKWTRSAEEEFPWFYTRTVAHWT